MSDRQKLFVERLSAFRPIDWELIPDLGLYMDQVITFIERQCKTLYGEGERIFTPAMVNNYVKIGLLSRPAGKKYNREHLAQLLMICVLKQGASAEGMKLLLTLPEGTGMKAFYEDFCMQQKEVFNWLTEVLPLPSVMNCVIRNAAHGFLVHALLRKEGGAEAGEAHGGKARGAAERKRPAKPEVEQTEGDWSTAVEESTPSE